MQREQLRVLLAVTRAGAPIRRDTIRRVEHLAWEETSRLNIEIPKRGLERLRAQCTQTEQEMKDVVAQLLENYLSEWADRRPGPLMGGLLRAMNQVSKSSFDRGAQPALGIALATNYGSLSLQRRLRLRAWQSGAPTCRLGRLRLKSRGSR